MKLWKNDKELYKIAKSELFVALVGDVLDKLGYQHQFLPPNIKPLQNDFNQTGGTMIRRVVESLRRAGLYQLSSTSLWPLWYYMILYDLIF